MTAKNFPTNLVVYTPFPVTVSGNSFDSSITGSNLDSANFSVLVPVPFDYYRIHSILIAIDAANAGYGGGFTGNETFQLGIYNASTGTSSSTTLATSTSPYTFGSWYASSNNGYAFYLIHSDSRMARKWVDAGAVAKDTGLALANPDAKYSTIDSSVGASKFGLPYITFNNVGASDDFNWTVTAYVSPASKL